MSALYVGRLTGHQLRQIRNGSRDTWIKLGQMLSLRPDLVSMHKIGLVFVFQWYAMFIYWQFVGVADEQTCNQTPDQGTFATLSPGFLAHLERDRLQCLTVQVDQRNDHACRDLLRRHVRRIDNVCVALTRKWSQATRRKPCLAILDFGEKDQAEQGDPRLRIR
jgi:hypothetical protein